MEQHFPKIRKLSPIFKHCYLEFPSNLNFLSELLVTQLTFWKLNKLEIARLIGKHLVFGCVQRVSRFYFSVFSLVLVSIEKIASTRDSGLPISKQSQNSLNYSGCLDVWQKIRSLFFDIKYYLSISFI